MKTLVLAVITFLAIMLFTGGNKRLSASGEGQVSDTLWYGVGKVDTIKMLREKGVTAISYALYTNDSSKVTSVVVRRVFNNVLLAAQTGDTIIASDSSTTAKLRLVSVTMSPIANEYWFIVTYGTTYLDSVHLDGVPVDSISFTKGDSILILSPLAYGLDTTESVYIGYSFQRFDSAGTVYPITGYKTYEGRDSAIVVITGDASGIVWNESATSMNWMLYKQLSVSQSTDSNHARHGVVRQYEHQ